MKTLSKKWTPSEFHVYLLLYAAYADLHFTEQEQVFILERVEPDLYARILIDFSQDNDYQRLQKLIAYYQQQTIITKDEIIAEIKDLFLADGLFHAMEMMLLMVLRKIF